MTKQHESLTLELHDGRNGLDAVRESWIELCTRSRARGDYASRPELMDACLDSALLNPTSLQVCVLRRSDGHAAAVLPLKRSILPIPGFRPVMLELPVHPHLPLRDIVLADAPNEEAFGRLVDAVVHALCSSDQLSWDLLRFRRIPGDSAAARLVQAAPAFSSPVMHTIAAHGRVQLDAFRRNPGAAAATPHSANLRRNLKRAGQALKRLGRVAFERAESPEHALAALRTLQELETRGWKGSRGTAIAQAPELVAFYRALVERFAPLDACRLYTLSLNEHPIAALFCLAGAATCHFVKIAYDETHSRVSPGNLLIDHAVRDCAADTALSTVDFLTDSPAIKGWKPNLVPVVNGYLFNSTPAAAVAHVAVRLEQAARQGRNRIRRLIRNLRPGTAGTARPTP